MNNNGKIAVASPQPVATISIGLMADGNVLVNATGQINSFTVDGMTMGANRVLQAKIAEVAQGPKVEAAPPGLRILP